MLLFYILLSLKFLSNLKSNSISSNVFPFVSGANFAANRKESTFKKTNTRKDFDNPSEANMIGKKKPTPKLAIHKKNVAKPIPIPLKRTGNISESNSHVNGPIAPWKNARKMTVKQTVT